MRRILLIVISMISILAFNSPVWGDTVSALLEEGIYAEETKGDLDEAMMIYKKIINEYAGKSANIAEAYYRLGTCYQKTGDETKAIEIFKELLSGFRGHKEIAADARTQLANLDALDEEDQKDKPLALGPVPWEAGETCWYTIHMPMMSAGAGKMIHYIKEAGADGNEFWRVEEYTGIPSNSTQIYLRSDVIKESLSPVTGIMKSCMATRSFNYKAIYGKNHIRYTDAAKEIKDIPAGDIVYNNEQTWEIIRRLPLAETYNTSYNAFDLQSGRIENIKLTVTGKETVTVPSGAFECYCLRIDSDSTIRAKVWVSANNKRYIVRAEKEGNTFELEKVSRVIVEEPVPFHDDKLGLFMSAPKGWHFVNSSKPAPYEINLMILSPELKGLQAFIVTPFIYGTLAALWDITMPVMKQMFKNFTPRTASWVYGEIDGLSSFSFVADYESEGKKMVEYRTGILDGKKEKMGLFTVRTEKETFDEIKPDIDGIVQSFKWDK